MKTNRLALVGAIIVMGLLGSCQKKCDCDNQSFTPPDGTFCYTDEGRQKEMLNYSEIVDMLTEYNKTRQIPLEKALGYQDTRINNFNFEQFKKYLGYIEHLSDSAKIKITGISFVSAAKANYLGEGKSYQSLIYMPTTLINGKQVAFDPVQSVKQGKLVTVKQILAKYNYNWPYGKKMNSEQMKVMHQKSTLKEDDLESGAGNKGQLSPPMN